MRTHEEISQKLKDRRLTFVAFKTGLSYPTVKRVADMDGTPSYNTLKALDEYLTQSEN